jgi:hypothetical protein
MTRVKARLLYCLGLLVFLELVARLGLALIPKTWEPVVPPEVGCFDPWLGWKLKPGASATSKRTGRAVDYEINEKGLRDKELTYEKAPDVLRVAFLGDSRTFGFGVPVEQHYTSLLAGYFKKMESVNLGIDGYGMDQELLLLEQEGFKYAPDLVLVYVAHFHNYRHMRDKVWGVGKPRFLLKDGGLVLQNSPVANTGAAFSLVRVVDQTLCGWWKTYKIFRDFVLFVADEDGPIRKSLQGPQEDVDLSTPEYKREAQILAEAILAAMDKRCKERGARLVLLTGVEALHKAALAQGVPSLNVTGALDNPLFKLPDGLAHFNEAGNGALAWELANFLIRSKLVPEAHLPKQGRFFYPEKQSETDARAQQP